MINEIDQILGQFIEYEIIVIDDGSHDRTPAVLETLVGKFWRLRVIRHLQNSGKSIAIRNGVKAARAKWVLTLDGDGQNDPADILSLYRKLVNDEKGDPLLVVAGYRKKRLDHWFRSFYSRIANQIRAHLLSDGTPDTGCGLKLFSREQFLVLPYFENMHRFIPALFIREGGRVISVEVNHRPRERGVAKYGFHNRFWVGIVDLFGVWWLLNRAQTTDVEEL